MHPSHRPPLVDTAPPEHATNSQRTCTPGQGTWPDWCDRHSHHYWCRVCDGYYGVPHSGEHGSPDMHGPDSRHGRDRHLAEQCACRPCKQLVSGGAPSGVLNQAALDAATLAVRNHPSTTFMAPCEDLARTVLEAAMTVFFAPATEPRP
jgi:hypothetical protein